MGRWPELYAGLVCAVLFVAWRYCYPHSNPLLQAAAWVVPVIALLLVGAGILLRRVRLTQAVREGIFLPESRWKHRFSGHLTGAILAATEGTAITLGMCHFALHASDPELLLAAAIGICTLAAIARMRRIMAAELRPEFAIAASAWISAGISLFFCLPHFWMQQNILPPPAYLEAGSFMAVMNASLAELPARRDGIIEALSAMQLLEAAIHWMLKGMNGIWGVSVLLFIYNSAICLAVGRFFADVATTFHMVRLYR
ncbi:MAG TPA: hypothetical protein PKA35_08970 [Paracoccus solventivorans]|nr:hypothetical protein [Paracoccus solventivorans]